MKKLYIACDMEGTACCCTWNEVDQIKKEYNQFREIMTNEVILVCNLMKDKFDEIYVKDGHWTETNILVKDLPENCKIIRGDDGRNLTGLDSSFNSVFLVGYHVAGGNIEYPFAHTISDDIVSEIRLNGKRIGETTLAVLNASKYNVPVEFISGDKEAVNEAQSIFKNISSVVTKELSLTSYVCKSPKRVLYEIENCLKNFVVKQNKKSNIYKPKKFNLEIEYTTYKLAKKYSNHPNTELNGKTVSFKPKDLDEFLKIINLCI